LPEFTSLEKTVFTMRYARACHMHTSGNSSIPKYTIMTTDRFGMEAIYSSSYWGYVNLAFPEDNHNPDIAVPTT
jgi:hypothetical protein